MDMRRSLFIPRTIRIHVCDDIRQTSLGPSHAKIVSKSRQVFRRYTKGVPVTEHAWCFEWLSGCANEVLQTSVGVQVRVRLKRAHNYPS